MQNVQQLRYLPVHEKPLIEVQELSKTYFQGMLKKKSNKGSGWRQFLDSPGNFVRIDRRIRVRQKYSRTNASAAYQAYLRQNSL